MKPINRHIDVAEFYRRHHSGDTGQRRYGFTLGGAPRVDWFVRNVGAGSRVLDIGCRDGTLTSRFMKGNEVVGVDVDDDALKRAREQFGFSTEQVDLNRQQLPFPDAAFDVVVMGEVLEHLQFPEVALGEIHRVLRPKGLFLGSVPNAFRLQNRIRFLMGDDFEQDPTHLHHFSPSLLVELLSKRFVQVALDYLGGRRRRWHPRLLGATMLWKCYK